VNLGELPIFAPVYQEICDRLREAGAAPLCSRDHVTLSLGIAYGAIDEKGVRSEVNQFRLVNAFATLLKQFNDDAMKTLNN